jgi:hypothetical protein
VVSPPPPPAGGPRPPREPRRVSWIALALTGLVAVAAIVVLVLSVGGGGSSAGPGSAESTQASSVRPPLGQWILTGTITNGSPFASAVETEVRAWKIERSCAHGRCRLVAFRQLVGVARRYDETTLVANSGGQDDYRADFGPVDSSCQSEKSGVLSNAVNVLRDHFTLYWNPALDALSASEASVGSCDGLPDLTDIDWSATAVPEPAAPQLVANPVRATSVASFHAAVLRDCARMAAQVAPLERRLRAGAALEAESSPSAETRGLATVGAVLPAFAPVWLRLYRSIPQPPGSLDRLWLRDIELNRQTLAPGLDVINLIELATKQQLDYLGGAGELSAERAISYSVLADAEVPATMRGNGASLAIERRLGLPSGCSNPTAAATGPSFA